VVINRVTDGPSDLPLYSVGGYNESSKQFKQKYSALSLDKQNKHIRQFYAKRDSYKPKYKVK